MQPGSPLIERRGGRQPGTGNRRTVARTEAILASGISPLDYLLAVMRDQGMPTPMRIAAAKVAALTSQAKPLLESLTLSCRQK